MLTLINQKLAINLVRGQLKKQFNREIPEFSIIYSSFNNIITFFIEGKSYKLENNAFKKLIEIEIKKNINPGQVLDFVIIDIDKDNNLTARLYYKENDKKLFVKLNT